VLLDGRLGHLALQRLDIGGDVERLDIGELTDPVAFDPAEELCDRPVIRHPGVLVADGGGEEFEEAAGGVIAGGGDDGRHGEAVAGLHRRPAGRNRDHFVHAISVT